MRQINVCGAKARAASGQSAQLLPVFIQLIASAEYARTRCVRQHGSDGIANLSLDILISVIGYRSAFNILCTHVRLASQITLLVIPTVIGLRWRDACGIDEVGARGIELTGSFNVIEALNIDGRRHGVGWFG